MSLKAKDHELTINSILSTNDHTNESYDGMVQLVNVKITSKYLHEHIIRNLITSFRRQLLATYDAIVMNTNINKHIYN